MKTEDGTLEVRSGGCFAKFVAVVLGAVLLVALLTPFDEQVAEQFGLYRVVDVAGETVALKKQVADMARFIKAQEQRMNDIAENHNKLTIAVQNDMNRVRNSVGVFDATFRGMEAILVEMHGTNAWEAAKSSVIERAKSKAPKPQAEAISEDQGGSQ